MNERTVMMIETTLSYRRTAAAAFRLTLLIAAATVALADAPVPDPRPIASEAIASAPPWVSGEYVYDGSGNIKSVGAERYTYDAVGRLKSATVGAGKTGAKTQRFEYDGFGNLKVIEVVNGTRRELPVDSTTNRLRSTGAYSATYDAAGNQISENGGPLRKFDAFNSMTVGPNGTEYIYDANDERIAVITAERTDWRWTVRDIGSRAVREFRETEGVGGTMAWKWSKDYVYRGGSLLGAYVDENGTTRRLHYHLDHLGTTRLITDGTAVGRAEVSDYPFGEEVATTTADDKTETRRFTGHERDYNTGGYLDYMHARFYSPMTGRFLSVDPGKDWDMHQPQSWNLYSYVRNNPVNATDPTGRCMSLGAMIKCAQVAHHAIMAVAKGLHDHAANNGLGKMIYDAERGDMQGVRLAQAQMTHEALTGMIMTPMIPSEGSATVDTTDAVDVVQRAMSKAELESTRSTGLVRGGRDGTHFVSDAVNNDATRARQRLALGQTPEVKVTMEVPAGRFGPPSRVTPASNMLGGGTERTATGAVPVKIIGVREYD